MAYKIREETLTLSGDLTGHIKGHSYEVYGVGVDPSTYSLAYGTLRASIGNLAHVECYAKQVYTDPYADTVPPDRNGGYLVLSATAGEATFDPPSHSHVNANVAIAVTTVDSTDSATGHPAQDKTFDLDISGTYALSVDVDLMFESAADTPPDTAHGVFHTPPGGSIHFFYQTRPGGTASATITAGGITATDTFTITDAVEVEKSTDVMASGHAEHTSQAYSVTSTGFTSSYTHSVGASNVNALAGAEVILDASAADTDTADGSVDSTAWQPRQFSLTGKLNSVDSDFPGSVDYICSRFGGDTSPGFTAGATCSRDGEQIKYTYTASLTCPDGSFTESGGENTFQSVTITLDPTWCDANGEFVTYTTDAGTQTLRNSLIQMQCWLMDGLTLTQDAAYVVDDCTSATDWTDMATGGGGLQNTASSATKTFAAPVNFAGYASLRINAQCAPGTASRTLTIGGKTYKVPLTATTGDVDIDLLNPTTGGADSDTTETKWPLDVYGHDTTNGPLEGLSTVSALTLSGLDSSHPDTYHSFSLVRKDGTQVSVMEAWAPRAATDQPEFSPPATNDAGTTTTTYANRGVVALTDGKQSLEEWFHVHDHIETASGEGDSWGQRAQTIAGLAGVIDNVPGWHATINAHADDSSDNLNYGYLNQDAPAYWLMGAGLLYVGGDTPWQSGVGLTLDPSAGVTLTARPLFTTLTDWPPGIGDVFGVGDGTEATGAIVLRASKVLRAQAHGVLVQSGGGRKASADVTLTPAAGELQSDTTAVGSANSGTDGSFRTTGAGLVGQTGGNSGSAGVVQSGARSASQAFKSAWLGWVALRIARVITGLHPSNWHQRTGPYHRAVVGPDGGILYSRADHAVPAGGFAVTSVAAPADTDPTDTEPRLMVGADSRLWLHFTRPADGTRLAYSDHDGETWSDSVSLISSGTHPAAAVSPSGTKLFAAYVGGQIVGRVQHPGDTSPAAAVTLTDSTGTALAVEDDSFGVSAGHAGAAPWVLHCLIDGETDTSEWVCHDETSLSFTRVV